MAKPLGGAEDDQASHIQQTTDGGYIVAGYSNSNSGQVTGNHGGYDYWIVKLDAAGNLVWQRSFGGSALEEANWISQTADGGYILTGTSNSSDGDVLGGWSGNQIAWVVKLTGNGDISWQKQYGTRHIGSSDESYCIGQTMDGGYILSGMVQGDGGDVTGSHAGSDFWLVKLDGGGNLVWQKPLGGNGSERAGMVQQASDGGYVITCYTSSNNGDVTGNHGNTDAWVAKVSPAGILEWQKALGGNNIDATFSIQQTFDAGFIIAGYTSSNNNGDVGPNHGSQDFWVLKLSPAGPVPLSLQRFDASAEGKSVVCNWQTLQEVNSSHFVIERSDDGLHYADAGKLSAAGNSALPRNYNFRDKDAFSSGKEMLYYRLRIVDIDGSFTYSNIAAVKVNYSSSISLRPNPAAEKLFVSLYSPANEKAVIVITDYAGRKLYRQDVFLSKGNNYFPVNTSALAGGQYILSVSGRNKFQEMFIKK